MFNIEDVKMVKRVFYINGQKFTAKVTKEGNDYVSICEEVGTADFGGSIKTSVANLKETTEEHLLVFPHKNPYNIRIKHAKAPSNIRTRISKVA